MNTLLDARRRAQRPLIAAHRGTTSGCVFDNTTKSARAALRSGADIVELDVVRSRDGVYYTFHDGYELMRLHSAKEITELDSTQVDELRYGQVLGHPGVASVERYEDVLRALPETFINVDRSWRFWNDGFLDELAAYTDPQFILLKSPPSDELMLHAARYPEMMYMVIASTKAEVDRACELRDTHGLNLVGVEALADAPESELADQAYLGSLQGRGLLVWLNALNLEHMRPLFCGYDDDTSLFFDPDAGWGRLVDYGADVIQTDWPWLVREYLDGRGPIPRER